MARYSSIICPYCNVKFGRYLKLKEHIEEEHKGSDVPMWILKEVEKMTEPKKRQGQKGVKKIKEVCPKCGEYLKTAWVLENRKFKRIGLCCPSKTCDYIIKDLVELCEGETVDKVKDFAEACHDQNSLEELKEALTREADETDMKTWGITEDQWRKALEVALIAKENNLSVDEAIKCIS